MRSGHECHLNTDTARARIKSEYACRSGSDPSILPLLQITLENIYAFCERQLSTSNKQPLPWQSQSTIVLKYAFCQRPMSLHSTAIRTMHWTALHDRGFGCCPSGPRMRLLSNLRNGQQPRTAHAAAVQLAQWTAVRDRTSYRATNRAFDISPVGALDNALVKAALQ